MYTNICKYKIIKAVLAKYRTRKVIAMPLSMIPSGERGVISRISGKEDTKRFLNHLGFVEGSAVTVINRSDGNLIVRVLDSTIAIGKAMANKIIVGGWKGEE